MPTTATLTQTPSTVPLLLKALATSSRKPGREPVIPELELRLSGLRADRERLAAYCGVCGFDSSDVLRNWIYNGGDAMLASFDARDLRDIPDDVIAWISHEAFSIARALAAGIYRTER